MAEYTVDSVSIQGYSHILAGKECQDSSVAWSRETYCAAIVCDGHGGEKYIRSAFGSRVACEVGQKMIGQFMTKHFMRKHVRSLHDFDEELTRLERSVICNWRARVEEDLSAHPISEDARFDALSDEDKQSLLSNPIKAYGSTFIAGVIARNFCFVLKLGDGNTVLFCADGNRIQPDELKDEDLQFNMTTSLCGSDADASFRHFYRFSQLLSPQEQIAGMTITSDGVINCYHTESAFLSLMNNVFSAYGEDDPENVRNELLPVLETLSEKGSGDDLSVAVLRRNCDAERAEDAAAEPLMPDA